MAQTKIWAVTHDLPMAVKYVMDHQKTWDGKKHLHSGIGLEVSSAKRVVDQMMATKRRWNKTSGRLAYHAEQSFKPGEVTPSLAHEIGMKFAAEVWGDRFEVLVTTHLDKDHIHNHFIINSVSDIDGKKYQESNRDYNEIIRATSDRICKEYGLSTIDLPQNSRTKTWTEIHPEIASPPTIHTLIYQDIDNALQMADDIDGFYRSLELMGYAVKRFAKDGTRLEHPSIRPPSAAGEKPHKFFRLYKFAKGYTEEDIINRLEERETSAEDLQGSFLGIQSPPERKEQISATPQYRATGDSEYRRKTGSAGTARHSMQKVTTAQRKADYWRTWYSLTRPTVRIAGGVLYLYSGVWLPKQVILWRRLLYYNYFLRRLHWSGLRWTYTKFSFILKSVERASYPQYPKMDLRRELHKLHQYNEEALLLHRHRIQTIPQLQDRLAAVNNSIHEINSARKRLRHHIKRCRTVEEANPLQQELQELKNIVAPLYHERALLKDIEERSQTVEQIVQQEQSQAQETATEQGKGEYPKENPAEQNQENQDYQERKEKYEL